jgi:NADH-quinone oxidoreductase subunit K
MTATALESQLVVGATLFILGMIGFLTRRNLILIMLSAELMLHGVSVNLTAFSRYHGNPQGQVFTIFVLTIAACEAGLALSMILSLYQRRKSLDVFLWGKLGEDDLPVLSGQAAAPATQPADPNADLPHLTPAGRMPQTQIRAQAKT